MLCGMSFFRGERRKLLNIILSLQVGAGLILLLLFVLPTSDTDKQVLFGLSSARLSIAFLFLLLLAMNIWGLYLSLTRSSANQNQTTYKIETFVSNQAFLLLVFIYLVTLVSGALLLLTIPPVPVSLGFLESIRLRLIPFIAWLFLVGVSTIGILRLHYKDVHIESLFISKLDNLLVCAAVFLITFMLYEHIASWIGWINKSRYTYWDSLAEQFLNGQLYLNNPPQTHDLTLYNGKWYVPNPPVPALMMLPFAILFNPGEINTGDFSIFFSAVNALIIFLILRELTARQWITTSRVGSLCLVALFAFGTPHLWVGINGRMWFVSQVVTVTFLGLGTLAAIKAWSPWLVGTCIGLAVGTRPNGLLSWPLMFAIAVQTMQEVQGDIKVKQWLSWCVKSIIPILLAITGLLVYNYARFENFLDFGYTTINGDPVIVSSARTYGLFSLHFLPYNLRVMLLYLPKLQLGKPWPILPSGAGMSLFVTTPALIYLFHRYERKIWIWGAWTAILFNFLMLALYHNAGKDQFGYRYILDFIVPIMALMAVVLGKKITWHFLLFLLISIAINVYGAYWFMNY